MAVKNLGEAIRNKRKKRGIKQIDLAKKLGVSRQELGGWERGTRNLPNKYLLKIPEALGSRMVIGKNESVYFV